MARGAYVRSEVGEGAIDWQTHMAPEQLRAEEEDEEEEGFIEYNGVYYDDGDGEDEYLANYIATKKNKNISVSASASSRLSKLPTLRPAKPQFVSISLPCSNSATPRGGTFQTRFRAAASYNKKWPPPVEGPRFLQRQPSSLFVPVADAGGVDLLDVHRSKSCCDDRSPLPPDEFDICTEQPSPIATQRAAVNAPTLTKKKTKTATKKKKKVMPMPMMTMTMMMNNKKKKKKKKKEINSISKHMGGEGGSHHYAAVEQEEDEEEDEEEKAVVKPLFKYTALCMCLGRMGRPASDKKKGARRRAGGGGGGGGGGGEDLSKSISLEKFECGSWASPRSVEGENVDTQTPVNAAFLVFEGDDDKVGPTSPHVGFSTAGRREKMAPLGTQHPPSPT